MTDHPKIDAQTYRQDVERSISFSGADLDTFTEIKAHELLELARRQFGNPSFITALDVGSGIGATDRYLAGHFKELHGVDVDKESVAAAAVCNADIEYTVYDGETLPYEDGRFDLVFAICVLHHIDPPDRPAFVRELSRVTRPGGLVAIFEHNPWNPLTRLAVARCKFDEGVVLASIRKVWSLLADAQLDPVDRRFIAFLPSAGQTARRLSASLRRLPFGAQHFVAARKR